MQVKANGIHLDVETYGDASDPALLLIRGLGTQRVHWADALISGFVTSGFYVITFDNRDVGLSERFPDTPGDADAILSAVTRGETPASAYTLDDMAADAIGLLDHLGIDRAHVFGISMGGAITQRLICDHADRLRTATIVMSAAGLRDPSLLPQLLVRDMDRAAYLDDAETGEANWGSPGFPASREWIRGVAGAAWDRGADAAGVNRQLLAIMNTPDRRADLTRACTPTLVIHGRDDTLIPWAAGQEIAELIPDARWQLIDGMGHTITPALAPDIVSRVSDFIAGTGLGVPPKS